MPLLATLSDVQKELKDRLKGTVIRSTYRDAVTGVGLHRLFPQYAIVTLHESKEVEMLRKTHPVISVEGLHDEMLERTQGENAIDPLAVRSVLDAIGDLPGPNRYLLPYEVSPDTYDALREKGWTICAMEPRVRAHLDAKDTFLDLAEEANILIPKSVAVQACTRKDIGTFLKKHGSAVLQGLEAAAGMDTTFLFSEKEINDLSDDAIVGPRRISQFIDGVAVSCEGCVLSKQVLASPPRVQVIGCKELARGAAHYCGNDWNIKLSDASRRSLQDITRRMGEVLRAHDYKGIFGIDAIWDPETDKIYAIELNPRLLGTSQLYILQQMEANEPPMIGLHVLSFLGADCEVPGDVATEIAELSLSGAHLIVRNTADETMVVTGNIEPGVYVMEASKAKFLRPAASFSEIKNPHEYLVTMVPTTGKPVGPDAQMIRVQARTQCFDPFTKKLLPEASALVSWLRTALCLQAGTQ